MGHSALSHAMSDPDSDNLKEARLIKRAQAGDQDALSELYRLHEQRAYNLALRLLGNSWDAADVTQEAFIKAFGALDRFRGEARFSTWLHRIVLNAARDHVRRRQSDPLALDEIDRVSSPEHSGRLVGGSVRPLDAAADGLSAPLTQALLDLDERFRLAVVLCDILGFDYSEAAEILEVKEGTIKSRIFRAREDLSRTLTEQGYAPCARGNRTPEDGVTVDETEDCRNNPPGPAPGPSIFRGEDEL
jgi:RNA polymerase sigma-70 factor (ECF subfamily)